MMNDATMKFKFTQMLAHTYKCTLHKTTHIDRGRETGDVCMLSVSLVTCKSMVSDRNFD